MNFNSLLEQVKDAVQTHFAENGQAGNCDPAALVQQIETLFQQHQQQHSLQNGDEPQGMDPYGGLPNEAGAFEQGKGGE
jgi:hypothetical protein